MNNQIERKFENVCEIINRHGKNPNKLIPILQEVLKEYRYLPEEVMAYIATSLDITPAKVYSVATFYSNFTLTPKGKYVIKVCDGTACHVKKSTGIIEAIRNRLQLTETKNTTSDMLFTLETVSCLGACGLAPVVVVNDDVHGVMTPESTVALIDSIVDKETKANE